MVTVISTFAGCGGSSLGYKWAGFKELLAIDNNKNAVETFKLNFDCPIWERDIKEVTGKEILEFCKIKKGELDVLDGSPPCQGFSTAGKRVILDERNDLFKEFIRLINELQPKVFVMENVSGMMKGKMKGCFNQILKELKTTDYNVKCKLMNAMWYDVPQSRQRLIFIGVRKDLGIEPSYPKPNEYVITVKEAFKNIKNNKKEENWLLDIKHTSIYETLKIMKCGESYSKYKNQGYNFIKLNFHKPSPTLTKTMWNKSSTNGLIHPIKNRKLTILEAKRLCSYPDNFKLTGKYEEQWARLGNSVMPKMMQAIAENIKNEILVNYGKT